MKAYYTECVLVHNGESAILGSSRVIIRVDDQGGGAYLVIRGENSDAAPDETAHDFFLQTDAEIDQFAEACKELLRMHCRSE